MPSSNLILYEADASLRPFILNIANGWSEELAIQLIEKSRQENILLHTPKDAAKRFKDQDSLRQWLTKGREVHWLLGPDQDLAGIIWYGPAEPPQPIDTNGVEPETFAIRIYDGYVGKGLARPFMLQSLRVLVAEREAQDKPVPFIWLETDIDNIPAVTSYTKLGYEEYTRDDIRVLMTLTPDKIKTIIA